MCCEINKYKKKYNSKNSKKGFVTQFEETYNYCTKLKKIRNTRIVYKW